jgi:hypothetical protein
MIWDLGLGIQGGAISYFLILNRKSQSSLSARFDIQGKRFACLEL